MDERKYLSLNGISSYKKSFLLSNDVWNIVVQWDALAKNTIGSQFVRAIDSISSNIAEGFGRYGKKDKVCFYRIARALTYESLDWLEKSKRRDLISSERYDSIFGILKELPKDINTLIKYTRDRLVQ